MMTRQHRIGWGIFLVVSKTPRVLRGHTLPNFVGIRLDYTYPLRVFLVSRTLPLIQHNNVGL